VTHTRPQTVVKKRAQTAALKTTVNKPLVQDMYKKDQTGNLKEFLCLLLVR
jgi:hypothetical protein